MIVHRPSSVCRQTTLVVAWFFLCAMGASARDFSVQILSDSNGNARLPSIGDTGLVAWQGYSSNAVAPSPSAKRSDIFIWRDNEAKNITGPDPRIDGQCLRPLVFRDSVLFTAWFKDGVGGGYPFELSIPEKNEEMRRMELDYPTLFDPPLPSPRSAVEADAAAGDTNPPPAEPEAEAVTTPFSSLQRQMWRSSGKAGDIAIYRPDGTIERISPGTRHFSFPVMSEAGLAFQCARGWPYGYEMMTWKPGDDRISQITTNYFYVLNPDIHENELVFQAWDGDDYEIFRYRFDTGEMEQITNNQFDDIAPVVWNGQIAWIAHPTVTAEIFLWSDGAIRKISEGTEDNGAPCIWEGKVVWQGYDDTDLEIYYFNGRRTIKLTSNTWDDMAPKIHERPHRVDELRGQLGLRNHGPRPQRQHRHATDRQRSRRFLSPNRRRKDRLANHPRHRILHPDGRTGVGPHGSGQLISPARRILRLTGVLPHATHRNPEWRRGPVAGLDRGRITTERCSMATKKKAVLKKKVTKPSRPVKKTARKAAPKRAPGKAARKPAKKPVKKPAAKKSVPKKPSKKPVQKIIQKTAKKIARKPAKKPIAKKAAPKKPAKKAGARSVAKKPIPAATSGDRKVKPARAFRKEELAVFPRPSPNPDRSDPRQSQRLGRRQPQALSARLHGRHQRPLHAHGGPGHGQLRPRTRPEPRLQPAGIPL